MKILEVMQKAKPNITEEEADFILWSRTPFPCGAITAKSLYQATRRFYRTIANHRHVCEFCDNLAQDNDTLCKRCAGAIRHENHNL